MNEVEQREASLERITLIAPVKDEEESVGRLLRGILEQTLRPSEVVITDGGSTDGTREIVREFQRTYPIPLVLVETSHAFPGRGRNLAIERASHEWIASIDAGIVPDENWLKRLVETARREPQAQVIYGRYRPVTDTFFTECAAIAYVPPPGSMPRFIASSMFRRSVWERAGGFPEELRSGEDLLFFKRMDELEVPAAFSREALVSWSIQPSIKSTYRRFATYSRYGMRAGLGAEWQLRVAVLYGVLMMLAVVASVSWLPLLLLPPALLLLRAEKRIYNWYRADARRAAVEMINPPRVLMVTFIGVAIDVAMFHGVLRWLWSDRAGARERRVA